MKFNNFLKLSIASVILASCSSGDDDVTPEISNGIESVEFDVPLNYSFVNEEGVSTVSFSGQTTRLNQGAEILKDLGLNNLTITEAEIDEKYTDGTGFSNEELNNGKKLRNKTAASDDYFLTNTVEAEGIRATFDGYIADQVTLFLDSKYTSTDDIPVASAGVAGVLGNRYVNENGLELDQAFNKGLIGALTLDQVINNYIGRVNNPDVVANHDADVLAKDGTENYTDMQHFWDEAYGYVYGAGTELEDPNSVHLENVVDKFLYKYIQRVNGDTDFDTYADQIFDAFKTGRAAIDAKAYDALDEQVVVLRKLLSEVVAIRAVYYLKQGQEKALDLAKVDDGSVFHDWSEGYGFIYSLRFTQNENGAPYFSKEEVDGFIETLDSGNGFWDLIDDPETVNTMAENIAAKFDFTVAQAETLK